MQSPPDDFTLARAQKGDRQALESVLRATAHYVLALCTTWCRPPLSPHDVAQETLIKITTSLASFTRGSAFFSWVYRICYRTFIDNYRLVSRRAVLAPSESLQPHHDKNDDQDSDDSLDLTEALSLLSDDHREILIAIDMQELSYEEAARSLGIAVGTVRSRLARARAAFKKILIDQGTFDDHGNVISGKEDR